MNPVLLELGSFKIYWYSIFILIGSFIAGILIMREAKRLNISKDFIFNLIFWTVIMGVIGARVYYIIFNWNLYSNNLSDVFKVWNGGLAIHGGLIFGILTMIFYCKKYQVETFKIVDVFAVPLLLAQAIGRWGNFFNGEAHGVQTSLQHLKDLNIPNFIIEGMNMGGVYYTPTFLYESLWCLVGFIILFLVRKNKYIKIGQLTCLYMMWYGAGRFFIEGMRTDSLMFGGFRMAQIISVVMFIVGLIIVMILSRKGKFEDLYNQESKEIKF